MLQDVAGTFGSDDGLWADARYTPAGGGSAVDCRALFQERELPTAFDGLSVLQTGRFVDLLRVSVPAQPTEGATIAILDNAGAVVETYTVKEDAVSDDGMRLRWRCRVGEPVTP